MTACCNVLKTIDHFVISQFEEALTPIPEESQKVALYVVKFFQALVVLPFVAARFLLHSAWNLLTVCVKPKRDTITFDPEVKLPGNVLLGSATSEFQILGKGHCPHSQWAPLEEDGEFFHPTHDQIIEKLQEYGMRSYRFSIEWSLVEPKRGEIHRDVIEEYVTFARKLKASGITPLVTLHHFSEPKWFADLHGFEKASNLVHFIEFVRAVSEPLSCEVDWWCTINEPTIYAFSSYVLGDFPPHQKAKFSMAGRVFRNLMNAHIAAYDVLKGIKRSMRVGLAHQFLRFDSSSTLTDGICKYFGEVTNEIFLRVLRGKEMRLKVPFLANVSIEPVRPIKEALDFLGVQYYVRPYATLCGSRSKRGEPMSQMPFRFDPDGLFFALRELHGIAPEIPLSVTETGLASSSSLLKAEYYKRSVQCVAKAIHEGVRVDGLFFWSLFDNFEWNFGHTKSFGLCNVTHYSQMIREFT